MTVRVMVVRGLDARTQFLVSTNRSLTAAQIIEPCSARWQIECTFHDIKQEVDGFDYGFWSKSTPELDRFTRSSDPDRLDSVTGGTDRAAILEAAGASTASSPPRALRWGFCSS